MPQLGEKPDDVMKQSLKSISEELYLSGCFFVPHVMLCHARVNKHTFSTTAETEFKEKKLGA